MTQPITVKMLMSFCKDAIRKGCGDKKIYISSDDEGNSFHPLYFQFTTDPNEVKDVCDLGLVLYAPADANDMVLLG